MILIISTELQCNNSEEIEETLNVIETRLMYELEYTSPKNLFYMSKKEMNLG